MCKLQHTERKLQIASFWRLTFVTTLVVYISIIGLYIKDRIVEDIRSEIGNTMNILFISIVFPTHLVEGGKF